MQRVEYLDGVRGLAVLIVYLSHTAGRDMAFPGLAFNGIGHTGVYLFFVLSGFLLTRNLLEGQPVRAYLIRRFFRIAPLYYLVLTLTFLFGGNPQYLHITGGLEGYVQHLLFIKGDGVFWTISAEFIFYLALPILIITPRRYLVLAALFYFVWFWLIKVERFSLPELKIVDIGHAGQFIDVFICGILAGLYQGKLKYGGYALFLVLALTLIFVSQNFLIFERPYYEFRWFSLVYGIVFSWAILSVNTSPVLRRLFEMRWLRFMGIVGFGWYLLHLAVFEWVNQYDWNVVVKLTASTLTLVVLSWSAYRFIEKPFIRIGRMIENRWLLIGAR